jgi:HK97 family phage major capsid protein
MNKIKQLNEQRAKLLKDAAALDTSKTEDRSKVAQLHKDIEGLDEQIILEARQLELTGQRAPRLSTQEERDLGKFSLGRALRASAGINSERMDGIEAELIQEGAREAREAGIGSFKGIMLPRIFTRRQDRSAERRDMTATGTTSVTGDQGGITIATTPTGLLDDFYNNDILESLGITTYDGLVGNLVLPRFVRGSAATHKAENGALDEVNPTTLSLSLNPRRLGEYVDVSEQLLNQSNANIAQALNNSVIAELRSAMQIALLHGTGSGANQPTGVAATTGITTTYAGGASVIGTNADGAAPVWADMVNLKKAVAVLNANSAASNYLFNEALIGKLEMTLRAASTDSMFILDDRAGRRILGKSPAVTNAVSSTLTKGSSGATLSGGFYGNWNDLVRAVWGGFNLEVVRDSTLATTGMYRIVGAVYYDGGVQRPKSFAYCKDFITA